MGAGTHDMNLGCSAHERELRRTHARALVVRLVE